MKKRYLLLIAAGWLIIGNVFAGQAKLPTYQNYPVTQIYQGKNANLNIASNPAAKQYQTQLQQAAQQKPNFAGHYIITSWGCGTFCSTIAIVDATNGQVYMPQFDKEFDSNHLVGRSYETPRVNSNLLIVKGQLTKLPRSNPNALNGPFVDETVYYLWKNNKPVLLHKAFSKPYSQ